MAHRVLSHDVVALVHHVELTAAGWRERLSEQLLLASLADAEKPRDVETLTRDISKELGRTLSAAALTAACQRLIGRGLVIRAADQGISLTQTGEADIRARRQESNALESYARETFLALASQTCPSLAEEALWDQFFVGCLEPTVAELGARTYQLMAGSTEDLGNVRSMAAFLDRFPEEERAGLKALFDRFLDPSDHNIRNYVLQQLNAHFLSLASSLTDVALTSLSGRLNRARQLRIFLDTNFLFSVLDLHYNPANDAARELVSLLKKLHGKLDYTLYVYPLTVDEVKRTLIGYESSLTGAYLTPKLGRAALTTSAGVSGLLLRYLRAVSESKGRITAHDFLAPYLTDPVSVLRSKGVELYNSNIEGLTTSQPVIDDIVDQQQFEAQRYPDRKKPYEALVHDIALWHLVDGRRASGLQSALDAVYWVVTIDYRFLGFDAHKAKARPGTLPICIHPAVLLQMLQLWLPRDEHTDKALFQGIRSLLPQVFDSHAEEATVRILTSLARYENIDDLDENTIAQILMNQALGDRIRMVDDVRQQVELVREAIVTQFAEAKAQLLQEQKRRDELEEALAAQRLLLSSTTQQHGKAYDDIVAEKRRVQEQLEAETKSRTDLEARLTGLERSLREGSETVTAEQNRRQRRRHLTVFVTITAICVSSGILATLLLPETLSTVAAMTLRRAKLIVATGVCGLASVASWAAGRRLSSIREAIWFNRATKTVKWIWGVIGAIFVGLVTTYLWERF